MERTYMRQKLLIVDDEKGIVDMMKSYFAARYGVLTIYITCPILFLTARVEPADMIRGPL